MQVTVYTTARDENSPLFAFSVGLQLLLWSRRSPQRASRAAVSSHIGTGSKSALWGLKHWPWRAAPAPTTDGNPPANPSSSRAHHYISVTSSSERGCPSPTLPVFLHSFLERNTMLPLSQFPFQRFPTKSSTWPRIRLVAGGHTMLPASKCLWTLRHRETEQYFTAMQPKHGASIPDPTSKAAAVNEARPNRRTPSALQSRPIKTRAQIHWKELLQWFVLSMIQYFLISRPFSYSGLPAE